MRMHFVADLHLTRCFGHTLTSEFQVIVYITSGSQQDLAVQNCVHGTSARIVVDFCPSGICRCTRNHRFIRAALFVHICPIISMQLTLNVCEHSSFNHLILAMFQCNTFQCNTVFHQIWSGLQGLNEFSEQHELYRNFQY